MIKALLTNEKLSREEAYEFAVQMSIFFGGLIQSEFLHRRGLLDSEFMDTRRSIYRPYLEMPRVRKWWMREGSQFYAHTEAFDMVSQMIDEIEAREMLHASAAGTGDGAS